VVAVSGTTSTAAMVSCAQHYLVNSCLYGVTGFLTIVAEYQIELFWAGSAFLTLPAFLYVASKVTKL